MSYLGDFVPGQTVRRKFSTHAADGAPVTLGGSPAIAVYKSGSTAESTAGVTLTVDYDSRTGLHDLAVDTSADAAFYASGNDFAIVITAGTVDGQSVVGTPVGSFSISNRGVKLDGGTVASVTDASQFTSTSSGLATDNDAYIGMSLLFQTGAAARGRQKRTISAFTSSGGTAQIAVSTPFSDPPSVGDVFVIG